MKLESDVLVKSMVEQTIRPNNIETGGEKIEVESKPVAEVKGLKAYKVSNKTVNNAVEKVNKTLIGSNAECHFSLHKATGQIAVKVIDKETGEVIREIPSEKVLDMVAKSLEMAGILMDEKG